jgi:hypothetical protein
MAERERNLPAPVPFCRHFRGRGKVAQIDGYVLLAAFEIFLIFGDFYEFRDKLWEHLRRFEHLSNGYCFEKDRKYGIIISHHNENEETVN